MTEKDPMTPLLEIPGPKSKQLISSLDGLLDARVAHFVADYKRSHDNFLVDVDGNEILDIYGQVASTAVGYNNPTVIKASRSEDMVSALANRPAPGFFPGDTLPKSVKGLLRIAPAGHDKFFPAQSGTEANELAFKAAFFLYQLKKRGQGVAWTEDEITSCMHNAKPGTPELAILSFENGFHGRGFGALSATRSKAVHKLDVPAFNWPMAQFPSLKYPLEDHVKENEEEVTLRLQQVEQLMSSWHCPVAGIIVEPIQSEGGDNHAPPAFFQGLQDIVKKHGAVLIADEVQTGFGATGKFWAHEHWSLREPVDIVTFAKKAQTAGYFYGNHLIKPDHGLRQFNTWMGDEARMIVCNAIIDEILSRDLVAKTARVGDALYASLEMLAQRYPAKIRNLRGKGMGTFIAFDVAGAARLSYQMKLLGVNIGTCGKDSIRLRPMLIFEERHIPRVIGALEKTLQMVG